MKKRQTLSPGYSPVTATPLGTVWVAAGQAGLIAVSLWEKPRFLADLYKLTGVEGRLAPDLLREPVAQIRQFLCGERRDFNLSIDWSVMTPFQENVLRRVAAIPFGSILTYSDIAREINRPKAARAVGRANAANPLPLVIPCHRIIGADGRLHGFSAPGGLETKAWLLQQEGSWVL